MARKQIKLDFKLPSSQEVNSDLNRIIKQIKQFNIDLKLDDASLNVVNAKLRELQTKASSIDLMDNKSVGEFKSALNDIVKTQSSLGTKLTTTSIDDKEIKRVQQLKNELGNIQELTTSTKNGNNTIVDKNSIESSLKALEKMNLEIDKSSAKTKEQQEALEKLKASMTNKVNNHKSEGYMKNSTYDNLLNRIGKLDVSSSKAQIQGVTEAINRLGTAEPQIVKLNNAIKNTKNTISAMKSNEDFLNSEENKQKLAQLEDELTKANSLMNKLKNNSPNTNNTSINQMVSGLNKSNNDYSGYEKETTKVQELITAKQKLWEIEKQVLQNKFGENIDTTKIDEMVSKLNSMNGASLKEVSKAIDNIDGSVKTLKSDTSTDILDTKKIQNQVLIISKAIDDLQTKKNNLAQNYKGKTGNSNELNKVNSELIKLKSTLGSVQNSKIPLNSEQFTNVKLGISSANNSLKSYETSLKSANSETSSFGEGIKRTFGNVGIYFSLAMAVRQLFNEFKEGMQYISQLDDAYTNISMTMQITEKEFNSMTESFTQMGKQIGVLSQDLLEISKIYANANMNADEVMARTKATAELSNISGLSPTETAKDVQSITNQFKLLDKEGANATQVTQHIGDVLTTVSANMAMDFGEGIRGMAEAIKDSGSVAESGGVSLEKYVAIIGSLMEQTGKSGSEIAQGYKMISARTLQVKSLTEEMGINEEDLSKAQKALDSLNISISDGTTGGLRHLDSILEDVGGKWATMNDAQKQNTAEALAGEMKVCAWVCRNTYHRTILNGCSPDIFKIWINRVLNYIEVTLYIKAQRLSLWWGVHYKRLVMERDSPKHIMV